MKNFFRKRNKKTRGMTLVELIIALAVFAVLGLLLVKAATAIQMQVKSANGLNSKVAVQGPIAEAQNSNGGNLINENIDITVKKDGSSTGVTVSGKLYSAADSSDLQPVTDGAGNQVLSSDGTPLYQTVSSDEMNGNLNLKYVDGIVPPTTAPGP